ncbi:MAG: ABC transporter permease [Opitutaceae bacterium]|nr:ABC transporter permease [Opitutaceae bacterium]
MLSDLKFALRQLAKFPGFTAAAVLTLAFGIGVNTQIFSLVNAFFLQPLPFEDADRLALVLMRSDAFNLPHGLSFPDFRDFRAQTKSLTNLIAYMPSPIHVSAAGQTPERTWMEIVTPNAFAAYGVTAALGRTLVPADGESAATESVAVLSHDFWKDRFGSDPGIVGRIITLNEKPFTVVGVARKGFHGFSWAMAMKVFVPSGAGSRLLAGDDQMIENRYAQAWRILGRLKPGVTLSATRTETEVIGRKLAQDFPNEHKGVHLLVIPEKRARPDPTFADFTPVFVVVFTGMVGLVLLIACANVANLMMARVLSRQREMVMRSVLGASRWRLIRQLLVESLVFAAIAGVLGYLIAEWSGPILGRLVPPSDIPTVTEFAAGWHTYVFTAVISLVAGVATGLVPALRASRVDLNEGLKEHVGGRASPGRHRLRNLLVVGQVTMSLVVLVGAGMFWHSLQRARGLNLGFRADHLLTLSLDLGLQGYRDDRGKIFYRELLEKIRTLPGVEGAGLTHQVPFDYNIQPREIWPENPSPQLKDGSTVVGTSRVDPGYLPMMGIPLRYGRPFAPTDNETAPRVAIINQTMADLCWPGQDTLGRRFRLWRDGPLVEVVGVTPTGKYYMLSEQPRPFAYLPLAQDYITPITLVVRTAAAPAGMLHTVQETVAALDPHLPVYNMRTMDEHLRSSMFALLPMRLGALLAGIQGVIGLLLAVMGLYAVVSFNVTQRTQEIGIRLALGADRRDVLRLVLRDSLRLTLIGLGIGLILALGLGLLLSRVLYGVGPADPLVFVGITALLLLTTVGACYWPARRAMRLDPAVALRRE